MQRSPPNELRELALAKMSRVLGRERAVALLDRLLRELGLTLATPDELLVLARRMTQLGGFEGAVGAILGVAAVVRGATANANDGGAQ